MKKNFKKSLSLLMAVLMLMSVVSVSAYAAVYNVTIMKGNASGVTAIDPAFNKNVVLTADASGYVTLPSEAKFARPGYTQDGWTVSVAGTGALKAFGSKHKGSKWSNKIYPHWKIDQIDVTFAPGADGVGATKVVKVNKNQTTTFPQDIFTRDGYVMTGWTTIEGGAKEFDFGAKTPAINTPVTYYPSWIKAVFTKDVLVTKTSFFTQCIGYTEVEEGIITVKNTGNATVKYTLPYDTDYDITVVEGSLTLNPNTSVKISVKPKLGLSIGNYDKDIVFTANQSAATVTVPFKYEVVDHDFTNCKWISDNNATYSSNGTKHALCANGCGQKIEGVEDVGTMKVFSVDNNTVIGIQKEYIHHKTVNFTAYGSGSDYADEDLINPALGTLKRYIPSKWHVNDRFHGDFSNGYNIKYVHPEGDYGNNYNLEVTYVEEQYDSATGTWTATGNTDVKSFKYSIGPSKNDIQEVETPNMIVRIIFGLLGELFKMVQNSIPSIPGIK